MIRKAMATQEASMEAIQAATLDVRSSIRADLERMLGDDGAEGTNQ